MLKCGTDTRNIDLTCRRPRKVSFLVDEQGKVVFTLRWCNLDRLVGPDLANPYGGSSIESGGVFTAI